MAFQVENRISYEQGIQAYEVQQEVLKQFQGNGFQIHSKPQVYNDAGGVQDYDGSIPDNLTDLTNEDLGNYMRLITGWMEYVSDHLAVTEGSLLQAKEQLELTSSILRLNNKTDEEGKKKTLQELTDVVRADARYVEVNSKVVFLTQYVELTKSISKMATQKFKTVSRRVSQVLSDQENNNRSGNIGNIPRSLSASPPRSP